MRTQTSSLKNTAMDLNNTLIYSRWIELSATTPAPIHQRRHRRLVQAMERQTTWEQLQVKWFWEIVVADFTRELLARLLRS